MSSVSSMQPGRSHGSMSAAQCVIIGGGPAGLMAAEQIAAAGYHVEVFERMPSVGRKFLQAGVGGLNLTHAEPHAQFFARYSQPQTVIPWLQQFDAQALRDWTEGLGVDTFVGSSGRVFPVQKKASTLLRAWLRRLHEAGVRIHTRHQWLGWADTGGVRQPNGLADTSLRFQTPSGQVQVQATAIVLALGGGSWARLGSDGRWTSALQAAGINTLRFEPSNCGFNYAWSQHMRSSFAGVPLKSVALRVRAADGDFDRVGEAMISRQGVQGALIYHASRQILLQLALQGEAIMEWDLLPDRTFDAVFTALQMPRGKSSLSNHLRKRLGLAGVKVALLYELAPRSALADPVQLASLLKCLPQCINSARPVDEAISTTGGLSLSDVDDNLMLKALPGVFCAGEMLDWDAPTGGYLLNACLASGRLAGRAAADYMEGRMTAENNHAAP